MNRFIEGFFYSNVYLGLYAIALCVETNLLLDLPLNNFFFYLPVFFCTCIYYVIVYIRSIHAKAFDERTVWYRKNLFVLKPALYALIAVSIGLALFFFVDNQVIFYRSSLPQLLLPLPFLVTAYWYSFSPAIFKLQKIRQTGWLKPFIVGFTWAGWVTVYPIIFLAASMKIKADVVLLPYALLFASNFLFFSINAIIFDIRDHRTDECCHLKTFPVVLGVRNTFLFAIVPLAILNLLMFFLFEAQQQFSVYQILIQLVPYLLLLVVLLTYRPVRTVLYYLVTVDGLVFVKAVCGISSVLFFKK